MRVDMDPVSIFEDALKGLATKDFDSGNVKSCDSLQASVNSSNDFPKPEPYITYPDNTPQLSSMQNTQKASEEASSASQNDIILSALINAGIAPSSLKPQEVHSNTPSVSVTVNPNVKVLNAQGTTILRVVPSGSGNNSPIQQAYPPRMASQLLKKPSDSGLTMSGITYVPNIIRKRPPSLVETSQPISKIRRVLNHGPVDRDVSHQITSFSGAGTVPTNSSKWYETPNVSRPSLPPHCVRVPSHTQITPRPYPLIKRDEDMDEDEDLAQAETYAEYIPSKHKTKVEIRFHVPSASWIPDQVKQLFMEKEANRINKENYFIITSDHTRKQILNQADCLERIRRIIRECVDSLNKPEPSPETLEAIQRRKMKANEERLREKKEKSYTKQFRHDHNLTDLF